MTSDLSNRLLAVIAVLVIAAGVAVAHYRQPVPTRAADAAGFQQLVGGLGFGPSVELSTCPVQFDPRLETTCNAQTGPIPAGGLLCPGCGRFLFSFSSRSAMHLTGPSATRNVLAP
ncbi:MAG: hypothetical protein VB859_13400 [Planctomycetaceae bacterium]